MLRSEGLCLDPSNMSVYKQAVGCRSSIQLATMIVDHYIVTIIFSTSLSKPQLNLNLTQPKPNMIVVGSDLKMTLQTTTLTHPPHTNSMSAILQLLMT